MRKQTIWLIIAASLIVIGGVIFVMAMSAHGWDFKGLSTTAYETNIHTIAEEYHDITVITDTAHVTLKPSDTTTVTCYEASNAKHTVSVVDGVLTVKLVNKKQWYEYIGIHFRTPTLTLAVPQGTYGALTVTASTGDVTIPREFTFENVDITESTGAATVEASVTGQMKLHASTGAVCVSNAAVGALDLRVSTGVVTVKNVTCAGDARVVVSTGKTTLDDVTCRSLYSEGSTGDLTLKNVVAAETFSLERSTGNITFDNADAAEIAAKTDTGDVTGSLRTEKVFITETDTGRVEVPKTITGGRCEITTDTGDIRMTVIE